MNGLYSGYTSQAPDVQRILFSEKKFKTSGACDIHEQNKYCKLNASYVWMLSIQ